MGGLENLMESDKDKTEKGMAQAEECFLADDVSGSK